VFIVATLTWAVAMPFATFVAARSDASPAMYVVAVAVYGAGSIICHQLPGRSFHVASAQTPVCARCTGIYAGAALAAAVLLTGTGRQSGGRTRIRADRQRVLAAALPTVATLLFEWSTGSTPSNTVRALAGFPLGAAVAWVIGSSLAAGAHRAPASRVPRAAAARGGPSRERNGA
jgi:4-amino-4-deoxy-L-arabinose transferase-like glycosyltransferase